MDSHKSIRSGVANDAGKLRPTLQHCLEAALSAESNFGVSRYGIFGGLTEAERDALTRAQKRRKAECRNGHDWTIPGAVRVKTDGARECVACRRVTVNKRNARVAAERRAAAAVAS